MIRKPQPKEAARAIADLLSRNGLEIPHALSLEVVATVEGFNDWNTMAAAIRGGSYLTPAALDADLGVLVADSKGPFKVFAGNVFYNTFTEYSRACAAASLAASDDIDANGRLCRVLDANDNLVAAYIPKDSTIHTFGGIALDEIPSLPELGRYIENNWDVEDVIVTQDELRIHLCDSLEIELKADNDSFMGYLQYFHTESGRVLDMEPPVIPVYYRQDGIFKVNPNLPDNLRIPLEKILSK
jgi:hypothetical protein